MNIKEAIDFGKKYLIEDNIGESTLKVRMLLSKILEIEKEYLIIHDNKQLTKSEEIQFKEYLVRLADKEPIQYIINNQQFMKLNFYVDENVLIPQPDTEILVEKVLDIANKMNRKLKILDLCTGSGAIGISIGKYLEEVEVYASDISKEALKIAIKNANQNNVKINFIESDLFENIKDIKFDIIVSNPPYIQTNIIESLEEEVKKEPIIALDGGVDGLDFYKKISKNAKKYLNENGVLALEIGYDQKEKVSEILKKDDYENIEVIKDLGNNDRVIICRR